MAVTQRIKNMDTWFNVVRSNKVILNDIDYYSIDEMGSINNQLITVYNTDVMSTIPACDCGEITGRFRLGIECPTCGTTCKEIYQKVEPQLWLRKLDNSLEFINPSFWLMMRKIMDKKIDCMRWLSDPKYNPNTDIPNFLIGAKEIIGERTYPNLVKYLPNIIHHMLNHAKFKDIDTQEELHILLDMYLHQKDNIFSSYLPIINKKLFVMENTTKGKFVSLAVSEVIDVVMMWVQHNSSEKRTKNKDAIQTATVISKLSTLYNDYFEKFIVHKVGLFRKHIYGARSHFTFRSVIASIPGKHQYDELWIPWAIAVVIFRPHLLNKLVTQRDLTFKKADKMLLDAVKLYIPLIDELLQELINEAPDGKILVLAQRNPSLLQGSSQLCWIKKFKTDPDDKTINISALIIKAPNGDYDGDELNFTLLGDGLLANEFKTLKPHYNIPDLSKPFSISGNLTLLAPANSILANYLSDYEDGVDDESISFNMVEVPTLPM